MSNSLSRILVIDDDALSRDLLALLLSREGYAVDVAESGEAALNSLQNGNLPVPAAVLSDLQMPGITGRLLARHLRETCGRTTRLIAISASHSQESLDGFDGFLLKPFTMQALTEALANGALHRSPDDESASQRDVLDPAVYNRLAGSMPQESLRRLYDLCLADARKREALLREAATRGDDAAYRREAHALKGGCGLVGAVELQTLAAEMERTGLAANYVATLDEILLACDRLHRMLIARQAVPDHSPVA